MRPFWNIENKTFFIRLRIKERPMIADPSEIKPKN
jgi:hypothetical protein